MESRDKELRKVLEEIQDQLSGEEGVDQYDVSMALGARGYSASILERKIIDAGRWDIQMESIMSLPDNVYIRATWDEPATENQTVCSNMSLSIVYPVFKVVKEYVDNPENASVVSQYGKLTEHVGHDVSCVEYGDGVNVAIECEDCNEVLVDYDRE